MLFLPQKRAMAKLRQASIKCAGCGKKLSAQQAGEPCSRCGSQDRNLAATEQAVVAEKARAVKELARKHFEIETGLKRIFRITGSTAAEMVSTEPIKLLEVNENSVPSGVLPLGFDALPEQGIPFPSVIVEITPSEFDRIQSRELTLPHEWRVADEIARPSEDAGGA